jgi:glucose-6-phosphate isomerase
MLKFDYTYAKDFIYPHEIEHRIPTAEHAMQLLESRKGPGNGFLGWLDLPVRYDKIEFAKVSECAAKIKEDSDILVVIGIGGSYLGAKAVIDALSGHFPGLLPFGKGKKTKVLFAGNNLSSAYLLEMLDAVKDYDLSVNVISKSGTTTEPAVAFRFFKDLMEKKYGKKEAAKRIYATTDAKRGALKALADEKGYETFVIPDDVGGRYSVLTPVGLLPIAAAGFDINALMKGAADMRSETLNKKAEENPSCMYALCRNILYQKGKYIELMIHYEPNLRYFTEWWKQLYGESEGKDKMGIFPAGCDFTADLHSMGQYVQDGMRILFETGLTIEQPYKDTNMLHDEKNSDGLNYLAGKSLDHINKMAAKGTVLAHVKGGIPNLTVSVDRLNEESLGRMIYFFEKACGISGYMLGVNPFDQPGVEAYKTNMFRLLGKPGYEE